MNAPTGRRWGAQTQLAVENFPISDERMPMPVIRAIAAIKSEAAGVNADAGVISREMADAIIGAADEVAAGSMDDQFPVDVFQTGSGTSTNMNVNEVVAHRASELLGLPVHPNDHVNRSQSSNDVFPTAVRIAAATMVTFELVPTLEMLRTTLLVLADRYADTVMLGRTHLMDAVPMTFGQQAAGWARGVQLGGDRLGGVLTRLCELPLGGTAVGTGLNAPAGFGARTAERLGARTGLTLREAADHVEAQSSQDVLLETSAACRSAVLTLHKLAGDLRLLGSGPIGGLGELHLPALQAGSSIMPGKVNPVIPEVVQQVAAQVVGNDAAITFAMTASMLQLNTAMPVIARNLLQSLTLTHRAARVLDEKCLRGLEVDAARMRRAAEGSSALVTALTPTHGYDVAASLVRRMAETGRSLAEVATDEGVTGVDEIDLLAMAKPHQV